MAPRIVYNKYQDKYVLIMEKGDSVLINADKYPVTALHAIGEGIVVYQSTTGFVED